MAKLMGEAAPPAADDAPMLARMAKIGIVPGKPFELTQARSGRAGGAEGPAADRARRRSTPTRTAWARWSNGWVITKGLGVYGTDYMKRAVVAAFGWPANLQEDAVYPYTEVDSTGQKLTGANKYTLTFAKGQTPPVNGFWSITMYVIDQGWWFVPEPAEQVHRQPAQQPEVQRRRLADALLPERVARQGQGSELAAGARRASSSRCCACTGRRRRRPRSSTAPGRRRRCRRFSNSARRERRRIDHRRHLAGCSGHGPLQPASDAALRYLPERRSLA